MSDGYVMLKPRERMARSREAEGRTGRGNRAAPPNDIPGSNYEISQPIQMRFNELISGVRSDVGVKIFGDDLDILQGAARQVQAVDPRASAARPT